MEIRDARLGIDDIEYGNTYIDCHFTYSNQAVRLEQVTLQHCSFDQSDFSQSEWQDCVIEQCDFSQADFSEAIVYRSTFNQTKLMGANFTKSRFKQTTIKSTMADYAIFAESDWQAVTFKDVNLRDTSFQATKIRQGLEFIDCQLDDADFYETPLKGVDFSRSHFTSIRFTMAQAQGAIMSAEQAIQIALNQGITVV
ncbi:pentapeptide repeat-containing protein [Weissella ceti]|uniref:Pentapeptide repeat-containing protein n=1 Tax=Weissella ceti TaxID=759620 RepID=A0ABT3E332_9LACO|nr:pentapeptide repeat-containing protein [Weissella ceti]MCW0952818.1 pentapeptide repeat-containing protein [Weissella ceti]QVK12516.1 pentapeptide repeat-containing protein [Weissella ceti]